MDDDYFAVLGIELRRTLPLIYIPTLLYFLRQGLTKQGGDIGCLRWKVRPEVTDPRLQSAVCWELTGRKMPRVATVQCIPPV